MLANIIFYHKIWQSAVSSVYTVCSHFVRE